MSTTSCAGPASTLMLLWEEYRQAEPDGYGYSRWCELYRAWEGRLSPTMRQSHPAGERMFVDYAGQTVELYDGRTGEVWQAQVFVAVMGASSYTYRRGELDANTARLDRLACTRACLRASLPLSQRPAGAAVRGRMDRSLARRQPSA